LKPYKETIGQIRVAGLPPDGASAWEHVRTYVKFHEKLISLSSRWASLREELLVSNEIHFGLENPSALDALPTDFGSRSSITLAHAEKSPISWPALSEAEMKRQPFLLITLRPLSSGTSLRLLCRQSVSAR